MIPSDFHAKCNFLGSNQIGLIMCMKTYTNMLHAGRCALLESFDLACSTFSPSTHVTKRSGSVQNSDPIFAVTDMHAILFILIITSKLSAE